MKFGSTLIETMTEFNHWTHLTQNTVTYCDKSLVRPECKLDLF